MSDHRTTTRANGNGRRGRGGRPLVAVRIPRVDIGRNRTPLLVAASLAGVLLIAICGDLAFSWGRVHPGVSVGGVQVGGMGLSEARVTIERELRPRLEQPVTVAFGSRRWTVTAPRVGAGFRTQDALNAAYAVGRTGGVGQRVAQRTGAWFGKAALPATASADERKLNELVTELRRSVDVPPEDAAIEVDGTEVRRTPAKAGTMMHADALRNRLLAAFVSRQRIVRLTVAYAPVSVTDEDAQRAFDDAKRMVSGDVTLTYEKKSWTVPAAKVGGWIRFRAVPWSAAATYSPPATSAPAAPASASAEASTTGRRMMLVATIDSAEVSRTLAPMVTGVGKPARDARFKVRGKSVEIEPSQVGVGVDVRTLTAALDRGLRGEGERTFAMALAESQPKLSTEQARTMGVKELISSYSTDYDSGNTPRVNNIHTLAKALDGKLVPPGGTFSFNGAVGERTAEKGYTEAPAIVNGKLVPQLGGGICQIGTTIFNAVFFSGFPVVERTNHSFYISHYPKGRDCTVSWGGPDFRFKNDSAAWVLIHTSYDSGSITISLYGTDPGYDVTYTTGAFTDVSHYRSIEEKDATLPVGKRVVTDSGVDGRKVVVVRTVTRNGSVVRKDTFRSVYKPKNEVVKVGTMKPAVPATSTPTPKP